MKSKMLLFCIITFLSINYVNAQFQFGVNQYAVSITDNQYGIPFIRLFPIYPGMELGATFLENDKPKSNQQVNFYLGYMHHSILMLAPYVKVNYSLKFKIKNQLALGFYGGMGYLHGFFPYEGYKFNEATGKYESTTIHQGFLISNLGFQVEYKVSKNIKPFVKYGGTLLGFSSDQLVTNLHIGIAYHL